MSCHDAHARVLSGAHALTRAPPHPAGPAFKAYEAKRSLWSSTEAYANPGPLQFKGPCADDVTLTLAASRHDYLRRLRACRERVERLRSLIVAGVSDSVLDAALSGVTSLSDMLELLVRKDQA